MYTFKLTYPEFDVDLIKFDSNCKKVCTHYIGYNDLGDSVEINLDYEFVADVYTISQLWDSLEPLDPTEVSEEATLKSIMKVVEESIIFGNKIVVEFSAGSIALGITAHPEIVGQITTVSTNLILALQTGSLYYAMDIIKNFTEEEFIDIYFTKERLLKILNDLETLLGQPLTESL